jgi:molybdenum-pterin binding domain
MMKLSARNQLKGTVVAIEKGAVNGVVKIEIAPGMVVTSSITNAAIDELGLAVGAEAYAVVKASSVMVAVD